MKTALLELVVWTTFGCLYGGSLFLVALLVDGIRAETGYFIVERAAAIIGLAALIATVYALLSMDRLRNVARDVVAVPIPSGGDVAPEVERSGAFSTIWRILRRLRRSLGERELSAQLLCFYVFMLINVLSVGYLSHAVGTDGYEQAGFPLVYLRIGGVAGTLACMPLFLVFNLLIGLWASRIFARWLVPRAIHADRTERESDPEEAEDGIQPSAIVIHIKRAVLELMVCTGLGFLYGGSLVLMTLLTDWTRGDPAYSVTDASIPIIGLAGVIVTVYALLLLDRFRTRSGDSSPDAAPSTGSETPAAEGTGTLRMVWVIGDQLRRVLGDKTVATELLCLYTFLLVNLFSVLYLPSTHGTGEYERAGFPFVYRSFLSFEGRVECIPVRMVVNLFIGVWISRLIAAWATRMPARQIST